MDVLSTLVIIFGASWLSGIRLYATIVVLGLGHRMEWFVLPGNLELCAHPVVLAVAGVLCAGEFLADKVAVLDSMWDGLHTFVRPVGGAVLAYLIAADADPAFQLIAALLGGGVSLTTHSVKASARAAVNTSPEPFSNVASSLVEDSLALTGIWLLMHHPVILAVCVIGFLFFAAWFFRKAVGVIGRFFIRPKSPDV